jgi:hypothetical protein
LRLGFVGRFGVSKGSFLEPGVIISGTYGVSDLQKL